MKHSTALALTALTLAAAFSGVPAAAQERQGGGHGDRGDRAGQRDADRGGDRRGDRSGDRGQHPPRADHGGAPRSAPLHHDARHRHDHYYPARGYIAAGLPGGALNIGYGGGHYYFHSGVWWRPYGGRFMVVLPPIGIVLPFLPSAYVSLWLGGAPYYYANGVYYAPAQQGYAVVNPPSGAEAAQPMPVPPPRGLPDPIIYPRNGQSAAQLEADRQECNRWATTQPLALAEADVFQRAVAACLDGRGYTVR